MADAITRRAGVSRSDYMFELQRQTLAQSLYSLSRETKARCEIPPFFFFFYHL